jgi:hypothetical protein
VIYHGPPPNDHDVIQQLPTASRFERVMIAAYLGDAVGEHHRSAYELATGRLI